MPAALTEKVNFGIASTAEIIGKLLPALKGVPTSNVVGVASRDKQRGQAFCDQHDCGEGMTYEELLNREDVEAVYVPLPTGVRHEFLKKAIAAGKHIYSEKPLSGSVEELQEVLTLCEKAGLQWMDGTMWYHSIRTKDIEKKLRSNELGPVKRVTASFSFSAPSEEWLNGGNGRTNKAQEPMGVLGDMGHYPLTAILWAFNWEMPVKVQAVFTKLNKIDTIIAIEVMLWFSGDRRAFFDVSAECPHRSQYEIVCEKGVIKVDDLVGGQGRSGNFNAYFGPFVGSGKYVQGDITGKDEVVQVEECDHVDELVKDFTECVLEIKAGGKPDLSWAKRSITGHTVMHAIFESSQRDGAVVML